MKNRTAHDHISPTLIAAGRVLLSLIACLLVVMPWTEYFCSFDRFLRGGPDLELGLLALASVVCMVLVLVQHARMVLARILSLYQRLSFLIMRTVLRIPARSLGTVAALSPPGSRGLHPSMYNLPMQV